MSESAIVSLIALTAMLVFAVSGMRARSLGWRKGLHMAAAWAGIFAVVLLFVSLLR